MFAVFKTGGKQYRVAAATVAAEVLDHARGPKIIAFKKRRRKNSRSKRGFCQEFTLIRITEILTDGKKANMTASPRPRRAPARLPAAEAGAEASKAAAAGTTAATRKAPAKKAQKPKAKAPAARAKKPA